MTAIPQRLLGEALLNSARQHPSKTAVIVKGSEYSYDELLKGASKIASYLIRSGLQKGDRALVYMHNSWHCILSIYGITLAGGVFLVINPQTKAEKLHYILNDSDAAFVLTEDILISLVSEALQSAKTVREILAAGNVRHGKASFPVPVTMMEQVLNEDSAGSLHSVIPNDLAALIYTSGSTGFPKGVMMTHQSMVFTSWSLIEYLRLQESDRVLLILPLAFDYGLYQLLMTITLGATLIVEQSFTFPATIYRSIEQNQPTVFPGVPTVYAMMIAASKSNHLSFPCIRTVTNTAAALPYEFIAELKRIFPNALIFSMYGLTECKRVCYLEPELIGIKKNSVGKAIPGTEVFLLTPEGLPAPPGEPGILHIRGPHVMAGYWKNEALSNEMLKPGKIPGERILCSNDWFTMDEEGFLYFQGRNDDIIKSRGEKVSPLEVEKVIHKVEGVREAAVFGVPDFVQGESVFAVVTTHKPNTLTEKEILKMCASHLELFMIPSRVAFIDEMPKSANGKIDKKALIKMFSQW